jgi:glutamyl/glutaminyl-tRNA synthetase
MAEESTTTEQVQEVAPSEQPAPATNWRSEPGAQAVFKELNELRERLQQEAADKAAKEEQDALKRGEHEQVIAKLKADAAALKQEHETAQKEAAMKMALMSHGVTDPLLIAGAMTLYDGSKDLSEYAAEIAAAHVQKEAGQKLPPTAGVTPHTGPKEENSETLLAMGDKDERKRILSKLLGQ